jgi:RNA polymerase sigma-70 factor, ECF subfamily
VSPPLRKRIESDSSFEQLYRLHRRDVYGAVLRDVRDPTEAEDVTQIAFLNALRAMRKGEHPEKPRAWLVTIARNVIRRRYRELMRRPQEVTLDPEVAVALTDVEGPTAGEITAAIRRLAPNQQRVILLREIQGRSYAEIADAMGLSLAAVETLLFRARRSLVEELEVADRVPATRQRRRGFFVLPLPWLPKLSFGFSLGRAGAAALVGSVAIVTVPLERGADRVQQPGVQRAPAAESVLLTGASPTSSAPRFKKERTKHEERRADQQQSPAQGAAQENTDPASESAGTPDVPELELPDLPDTETVPGAPLPVQPPPLPVQPPPLPVEPPPLPVQPPPLPVQPPPLPDLPPPPTL